MRANTRLLDRVKVVPVGTGIAVHSVSTQASNQHVCPVSAEQPVVAVLSDQPVIAVFASQHVVPAGAVEAIIAAAATELVRIVVSESFVVAVGELEAFDRIEGIAPSPAGALVPVLEIQRDGARVTHGVVPRAADHLIGTGTAQAGCHCRPCHP